MRATYFLSAVLAAASLSVVCGCKSEVKGTPISLARFGGAVKLRLNLQKGDVYRYATESYDSEGQTKKQEDEYEVINTGRGQFQILRTLQKIKIEGGRDIFGVNKTVARRMRGMRIDQEHDKYAATLAMTAVSLDPDIQQIVATTQALSPGLCGVVFPEAAVKVGSQWHVNVDLSVMSGFIGGGMDFGEEGSVAPVTYTLKGAEEWAGRNVVVVDYEMKAKFAVQNFLTLAAAIMGGRGDSRLELSCIEKGSLRIDVATGMPVHEQGEAKVATTFGSEKRSVTLRSQMFLRTSRRGGILSKFSE